MKKLAIGCGLVVLLTGVAAAGVAYYLYRQVSAAVTQLAEFGQVPEIERSVRNQETFTPPGSAELTEKQLEQLIQVQQAVRQRLGEHLTVFEAKYRELTRKKDATYADAPAILQAYRDLAASWLDAKRAQVEALNATGLSLEEYRWIRDQAYRALGQPFVDLDLGRIIDEARRGIATSETAGQLRGSIGPAGPEANKKLIGRVMKLLEENLALASFGL